MKHNQPVLNEARVEAFIASAFALLAWLLKAVLRAGLTGRSARLRKVLTHAELAVECTLFCKAMVIHSPLPNRRPSFMSPKPRRLALFFKGARIRARKANVLTRIFALIDALARPERAIAYFLKRMRKGLRFMRHIPRRCEADAVAHHVIALPAIRDTS